MSSLLTTILLHRHTKQATVNTRKTQPNKLWFTDNWTSARVPLQNTSPQGVKTAVLQAIQSKNKKKQKKYKNPSPVTHPLEQPAGSGIIISSEIGLPRHAGGSAKVSRNVFLRRRRRET